MVHGKQVTGSPRGADPPQGARKESEPKIEGAAPQGAPQGVGPPHYLVRTAYGQDSACALSMSRPDDPRMLKHACMTDLLSRGSLWGGEGEEGAGDITGEPRIPTR